MHTHFDPLKSLLAKTSQIFYRRWVEVIALDHPGEWLISPACDLVHQLPSEILAPHLRCPLSGID